MLKLIDVMLIIAVHNGTPIADLQHSAKQGIPISFDSMEECEKVRKEIREEYTGSSLLLSCLPIYKWEENTKQ